MQGNLQASGYGTKLSANRCGPRQCDTRKALRRAKSIRPMDLPGTLPAVAADTPPLAESPSVPDRWINICSPPPSPLYQTGSSQRCLASVWAGRPCGISPPRSRPTLNPRSEFNEPARPSLQQGASRVCASKNLPRRLLIS